jgi:hypothetical protein
MNVLELLQGPAVLVLFPVFMLVLLRVIAPNGVDLDEMLRLPSEPEWPRGMQEEDGVRWRVELLSRRTDPQGIETADPAVPAKAPVTTGAKQAA